MRMKALEEEIDSLNSGDNGLVGCSTLPREHGENGVVYLHVYAQGKFYFKLV